MSKTMEVKVIYHRNYEQLTKVTHYFYPQDGYTEIERQRLH